MYLIKQAQLQDSQELAQVHIKSWQQAYQGIINQNYLDNLKYDDYLKLWENILSKPKDYEITFVMTIKNKIVGFISVGKAREDFGFEAELYAIYLLKEYHGKGLGQQLFLKAINWLKDNNFKSMYCWVLQDNPTYKFYEKSGAKALNKVEEVKFDEQTLNEVVYYWKFSI